MFPISGRGISRLFCKLLAEILICLISYLAVYFGKRDVRPLDQSFRLHDAKMVDIRIYRHFELFEKQLVDVVESHARAFRDVAAGDFVMEIGGDVIDRLAQIFDSAVKRKLLAVEIGAD